MNIAKYFLALVVLALPSTVLAQSEHTAHEALGHAMLGDQRPYFNPRLIPTGRPGFTEDRVRATNERPGPSDGTGSFRTVCEFSHMNQDDPIVFPGQKGAAHLHTYFGNKGTNFSSTMASIARTGATTCRGGTVNRSAYWLPSMIDTRQGRPLAPANANIYYKSGYHSMPLTRIQPIPAGLRMIAGNMHARGPNRTPPWDSSHNYYFSCHGTTPDLRGESIPNCPLGSELWVTVVFPAMLERARPR